MVLISYINRFDKGIISKNNVQSVPVAVDQCNCDFIEKFDKIIRKVYLFCKVFKHN